MANYPDNTNIVRYAQSDVPSIKNKRYEVVEYNAGSPGALVANHYVVSVDMQVGAYTLANSSPTGGGARNVTVGHTATSTADTLGTITVTGTDLAGAVISEVITPSNGTTVQGTKAFATVTSVVGAGWVAAAGADKIVVGFGDLIGLPSKMEQNSVLFAVFNGVREATAPTVTSSKTVLSLNTMDLNSVLDGSTVSVYYVD